MHFCDSHHIQSVHLISTDQLQHLEVFLGEAGEELFKILQTNTTLKALRVLLCDESNLFGNATYYTSLQNMLVRNRTLQSLEIKFLNNFDFTGDSYYYISSAYLPYLINGIQRNTGLQELSIPFPVTTGSCNFKQLISAISNKRNITQLKLLLLVSDNIPYSCSDYRILKVLTDLYYGEIIPLLTELLNSHKTLKLLSCKQCFVVVREVQPCCTEAVVDNFLHACFHHPSLSYVCIMPSNSYNLPKPYQLEVKVLTKKIRN